MSLICPQCGTAMNEAKAPAKTGYFLVLDQCPRCGGIWCDRWEVFPLTSAGVEKLDSVNEATLRQPVEPVTATLQCPRCRARLARFRDPVLPADARIERCPNCEGMWFNRGELRRLKSHATAALGSSPAVGAGELEHLTTAVRDPATWSTVSDLGAAMSASPPEESPDAMRKELVSSATWMVARAVLRLLLHI